MVCWQDSKEGVDRADIWGWHRGKGWGKQVLYDRPWLTRYTVTCYITSCHSNTAMVAFVNLSTNPVMHACNRIVSPTWKPITRITCIPVWPCYHTNRVVFYNFTDAGKSIRIDSWYLLHLPSILWPFRAFVRPAVQSIHSVCDVVENHKISMNWLSSKGSSAYTLLQNIYLGQHFFTIPKF